MRPGPGIRRDTARPLDPVTRADMELRFGHRFDGVRIHCDDRADMSATALGARAFTVRNDIVFASGAYAPRTAAGRHLLAHELAHVIQQRDASGTVAEGGLRIDPPDSRAEVEAHRVADAVVAGGRAPPIAVRHAAPVIGRSTAGAVGGGILGGVLGGVTTALLGSALGPAGAVIGGILGTIGGAIGGAVVGNIATTRYRRLTPDERTYAREIFLDSIDYDIVEITRNSMAAEGAARTVGNSINLLDHHFVGDTMDLSPGGLLTLIHELGHVWQYQNGGLDYISSSLVHQAVAAGRGTRNAAYNWRAADDARIPWESWNAEQQAQCISDYNEALRRINDNNAAPADFNTVVRAEPYIERVRRREGAPGAKAREGSEPAAAGTGATP